MCSSEAIRRGLGQVPGRLKLRLGVLVAAHHKHPESIHVPCVRGTDSSPSLGSTNAS